MSASQLDAYVGDVKPPSLEENAAVADAARLWRVTDESEYLETGAFLLEVKEKAKQVKKSMDSILAPLKQAEKQVRDLFTPALRSLETAEASFKAAMAAWRREQDKVLEAQAQEAQKLLSEGRGAEAVEMVQAMQLEPTKAQGVSFRKTWKARVVDEKQVPREFLVVDQSALNAYAKATKGKGVLAGVEFYEEDIVSARAG